MKLYFLLALLFVTVAIMLYLYYRKEQNKTQLMRYIGVTILVVFYTYMSKVLFIHKPLFVIHLALLLLSYSTLLNYLIRRKLNLWFLFSPAFTTLFFIIEALVFKEFG